MLLSGPEKPEKNATSFHFNNYFLLSSIIHTNQGHQDKILRQIFISIESSEIIMDVRILGLQQYTDASVNHDIFSNDTNIDI